MKKELPSLEYLNECFELDETLSSGLRWKVRPRYHFNTSRGWNVSNTKFAGKEAGTLTIDDTHKYWTIKCSQNRFLNHCVIYVMFTKDFDLKVYEIDHIDGNSLNNTVENLRKVTPSQNQCNRMIPKSNTSGLKGVSWFKAHSKWRADIKIKRVQYYLGSFDTPEEAHNAYLQASERLHGEFRRVA